MHVFRMSTLAVSTAIFLFLAVCLSNVEAACKRSGNCKSVDECCPGLRCYARGWKRKSCRTCTLRDDYCKTSAQCCDDFKCYSRGLKRKTCRKCTSSGSPCKSSAQCCFGLVCYSRGLKRTVCRECTEKDAKCKDDEQCCGDLRCFKKGGIFAPKRCRECYNDDRGEDCGGFQQPICTNTNDICVCDKGYKVFDKFSWIAGKFCIPTDSRAIFKPEAETTVAGIKQLYGDVRDMRDCIDMSDASLKKAIKDKSFSSLVQAVKDCSTPFQGAGFRGITFSGAGEAGFGLKVGTEAGVFISFQDWSVNRYQVYEQGFGLVTEIDGALAVGLFRYTFEDFTGIGQGIAIGGGIGATYGVEVSYDFSQKVTGYTFSIGVGGGISFSRGWSYTVGY